MKMAAFRYFLLWSACLVGPAVSCTAQNGGVFEPYTSCSLEGGPAVVETAPLAPGITTRALTTLHGPYSLRMLAGRRVMFAYPEEDFYANVKVELLPTEDYAKSKEALIADFDHLLATDGNSRNYTYLLKPGLNGFNIQGLDRSKREGGVLGVYLLFDDPTHIVMTIYFLNQEPPKRFTTMAEYATLRDRFLAKYTACIRSRL